MTNVTKKGLVSVIVFIATVIIGVRVASLGSESKADTTPYIAPSFTSERLDETTWKKHDNVSHVTCYIYYYALTNSTGGISCIPDSQLQVVK